MKINKIYVVAALHGDEPFGLKVLAHLYSLNDGRVITRIGHPEAVAKRREFLEANLNRSFAPDTKPSKEAQIAQRILADIKKEKPDLIIDLHTCECNVGKSAIIPNEDPKLINVAKRLGMEYVFIGVPSITRVGLIGQNPDKSIILEFGRGLRSDRLAELLAERIVGLLDEPSESSEDATIPVYSDSCLIERSAATDLELLNYVFNERLGGYPYLVGKNTYIDYVGFMAKKVKKY